MVKVADSTNSDVSTWAFSPGYTSKAEANYFCTGCHTVAKKDDFVFTNKDFFKAQ